MCSTISCRSGSAARAIAGTSGRKPTAGPPAAHQKDRLEAWLVGRVCSGAMQLDQAQRAIAQNWLAEYHRARLG